MTCRSSARSTRRSTPEAPGEHRRAASRCRDNAPRPSAILRSRRRAPKDLVREGEGRPGRSCMDRKRLLRNPLIWILAAVLVFFAFSVLFDDTRGYHPGRHVRRDRADRERQRQERPDRRPRTAAAAHPHQRGRGQHPDHHAVPGRHQRHGRQRAGERGQQAHLQHRGAPGFVPDPDVDLHRPAGHRPADPVLDDEQRPGRRQPGDELRQVQGQAAQQGHAEDDLRRRRGRRRGRRRALRDQGLPAEPGPLPGPRREDPQGRAALRPARHRQDPAGARGRGRGGRAVLHDLRLGLRRDVRRRRRLPRARPVRAGQAELAVHHLRRRDRRGRPPARRGPRRRPRRARADAQPAARRDGRLRRAHQRHPHRGHQPARHPRPGAAAPRPVRPPDPGQRARSRGPPRGARGARQGQAVRARRQLRRAGQAHRRHVRRRPRQRHQRGRAAHRARERHA